MNIIYLYTICVYCICYHRGRHGRDRMVVGFTTTYAISAYHHKSCEFRSRSWRGVLRVLRFPPLVKLTATI
jgi:hypothetical protein